MSEEQKYLVEFMVTINITIHPDTELTKYPTEKLSYSVDIGETEGEIEIEGTITVSAENEKWAKIIAEEMLEDESKWDISEGWIESIDVEIIDAMKEEL